MKTLTTIEKLEKSEHRGIRLFNDGAGWKSRTKAKIKIRKYRRVGKREKNKRFFRKLKKKFPHLSNRKVWRKVYGSIRNRSRKAKK